MKKVLFLDIDGVVFTQQCCIYYQRILGHQWFSRFCPIALSNLEYLLEKIPELVIILSSSWRQLDDHMKRLEESGMPDSILKKIIGTTPSQSDLRERYEEIDRWLYLNPGYEFVIIDDDWEDMGYHADKPYFIRTNPDEGLMYSHIKKILKFWGINATHTFG